MLISQNPALMTDALLLLFVFVFFWSAINSLFASQAPKEAEKPPKKNCLCELAEDGCVSFCLVINPLKEEQKSD